MRLEPFLNETIDCLPIAVGRQNRNRTLACLPRTEADKKEGGWGESHAQGRSALDGEFLSAYLLPAEPLS